MQDTYSISETARRLAVPFSTIQQMVRDGRIVPVGEERGKPGRPALLVDLKEAHTRLREWQREQKARRARPRQLEESLAEKMAQGRPLDGTAIGMGEAERKYDHTGVSKALISQWVAKGEVQPYSYAGDGKVEKIDEATLWDRLQTYRPRARKYGQKRMIAMRRSRQRSPYGTPPNTATPPSLRYHATPSSLPESNGHNVPTVAATSDTRSTAHLVSQYKDYCQNLRKGAEGTWDAKMRVLGPLIEAYPVLPTDTSTLSDFLASLKPRPFPGQKLIKTTYTGATLHLFWRNLKAFYNHLKAVRNIPADIAWGHIRPERDTGLPRVLASSEWLALVDHATTQSYQDYVMVRLLLGSGPRAGEVASLDDTDLAGLQVMVQGKTGQRSVPVNQEVADLLARLVKANGPGPMFRDRSGNRIRGDGITHRVIQLMRGAGINGAKVGAHTLRHTFATKYYRDTRDLVGLSRILGHVRKDGGVNVQTTQIYITLAATDIAEAYDKFTFGDLPRPPIQGELPLEGGDNGQ